MSKLEKYVDSLYEINVENAEEIIKIFKKMSDLSHKLEQLGCPLEFRVFFKYEEKTVGDVCNAIVKFFKKKS